MDKERSELKFLKLSQNKFFNYSEVKEDISELNTIFMEGNKNQFRMKNKTTTNIFNEKIFK